MKRFLVTLLLSLFTLPVLAKNTILIMGDSISAGYGVDPKETWVALLQEQIKNQHYDYQVVNSSITGMTSSGGLDLLPQVLKKYHPKITIIELGNNDGLRGLQPPIIKNNLEQMIKLTKQAGSEVIILNVRLPPNFGAAYIQQFQQFFTDLAKRKDITVVLSFLNGVEKNPKFMQTDGAHPTTEAQPILMNNVWVKLEKLLQRK